MMRCYRRLLNIAYKDMLQIRRFAKRFKQPLVEYEELMILIKKWKLRWFGIVSISSGLAKAILGTVKERERRSRQKKRWEDNSKEWKWIVAKSFVMGPTTFQGPWIE